MILNVIAYPDAKLDTPAINVEKITEDILKKVHDMFDTMYEHNGVGLAANQVGLKESILVFDCTEESDEPTCLLNPKVISSNGYTVQREGCLSFPNIGLFIKRSGSVQVSFMDINGKQVTKTFKGLESVCIQHEIDHLNGITFLERVNRNTRRKTLKEMRQSK
jgi:peptide deformylase